MLSLKGPVLGDRASSPEEGGRCASRPASRPGPAPARAPTRAPEPHFSTSADFMMWVLAAVSFQGPKVKSWWLLWKPWIIMAEAGPAGAVRNRLGRQRRRRRTPAPLPRSGPAPSAREPLPCPARPRPRRPAGRPPSLPPFPRPFTFCFRALSPTLRDPRLTSRRTGKKESGEGEGRGFCCKGVWSGTHRPPELIGWRHFGGFYGTGAVGLGQLRPDGGPGWNGWIKLGIIGLDSRDSGERKLRETGASLGRRPTLGEQGHSCSEGKHTRKRGQERFRLRIQTQVGGPRARTQALQQQERKAEPHAQEMSVAGREWCRSIKPRGRRGRHYSRRSLSWRNKEQT